MHENDEAGCEGAVDCGAVVVWAGADVAKLDGVVSIPPLPLPVLDPLHAAVRLHPTASDTHAARRMRFLLVCTILLTKSRTIDAQLALRLREPVYCKR